ncbi:MAG: hypothetical protein HC836_40850 [Richelia sp. RM2_1_2]|nr:hypothetical protein [Richelia sp. RM2_1_2]
MFNYNSVIEKAFKFSFSSEHVFFFVDCEENNVIYNWITDNIKGTWDYYRITEGESVTSDNNSKIVTAIIDPIIIICIKDEKDAALFKLTWL